MKAFISRFKPVSREDEKTPQLGPLQDRPPTSQIATAPTLLPIEPTESSTTAGPRSTQMQPNNPTLLAPKPASIQQTVQSSTLYSQSNNSPITSPASWSMFADADLVANLNSRERTRQEALFQIVYSEERYANELARMKETFIDPLLHSLLTSASSRSSAPYPGSSRDYDERPSAMLSESSDHLPIASRFLSSFPTKRRPIKFGEPPTPETSDDDTDYDITNDFSPRRNANRNHRSPYRTTTNRHSSPFQSSSHISLPPLPGVVSPADSAQSPNEGTTQRQGTKALRWRQKSSAPEPVVPPRAVPPHQLPEDLRICLEVIDDNLFVEHIRLSEGFKKRYEDQFPLVRSLADVFVSHSHILKSYAKYVLHLEGALEQVDNAARYVNSLGRKPSKKQEGDELFKVGAYLQRLEENAAEKGETGLAISLSKPFQRLLVYPVMFQNLLSHTDPSTSEYQRTLQMVAEVEEIVQRIEDEKIEKEERDNTRDVFGRIGGLEKVKQLVVPNSRVLVEERMVDPSPGPSGSGNGGIGGKKDLWIVEFSDVALICQRTGITSSPIRGGPFERANSTPEVQGRSKFVTTGRRNSQAKPRNLYKFIKIDWWRIGPVAHPHRGAVSMDKVADSRALHKRVASLPDNGGGEEAGDSDDSGKSFFSWGPNTRFTLQKPGTSKPRRVSPAQNGARRGPKPGITTHNSKPSPSPNFGTHPLSA